MNRTLKIIISTIIVSLVAIGIYYSYENNFFKRYSADNYKDLFVDVKKDRLNVYVKFNENEYIGYRFIHDKKKLNTKKKISNYDVWKLNGASYYERNKYGSFWEKLELVTTGEWELAIREKGANDFVGGNAHGDEINTNLNLFLDGDEVSLDEKGSYEADELEFKVESDLYRNNTLANGLDPLGQQKKTYNFNYNGLILEQEVNFDKSIIVDRAYLGMLPMLRDDGNKKVTDTYRIDDNKKEYDVSGVKKELNVLVYGEKLVIYSEDSGVEATMEILEKGSDIPPQVLVWNDSKYNKMYFIYATDDYEVESGEEWSQITKYNITVN